jgi:hypothetical protein
MPILVDHVALPHAEAHFAVSVVESVAELRSAPIYRRAY